MPFIGAVSLNDQGHPLRAKLTPLPGFTRTAIAEWAGANLAPTSTVISDGLACLAGATDIGFTHQPTVVGARKPKDLPMFRWVNTVLGNLKSARLLCRGSATDIYEANQTTRVSRVLGVAIRRHVGALGFPRSGLHVEKDLIK